jgi:hypothetical protein
MTGSDRRLLQEVASVIYKEIDAGVPVASLSRPEQIFIRVHSAQGCIDNGGLSYFFDHDTVEPYSHFADAYRAIGVGVVADCIEQAVAAFGLREPHREYDARREWMFDNWGVNALHDVDEKCIDASDLVWSRLTEHVRQHPDEFAHRE